MGREIERKFLVKGDGWRPGPEGLLQRQGYLAINDRCTVRVRIEGGRATLTVKGRQKGITRMEFEAAIDPADAKEMLENLCALVIEKTRYCREHEGRTFEVDVFHGENAGLVTAEVEIPDENAPVSLPDWIGREVSEDHRYRVSYLVDHPYRDWKGGAEG